MPLTAPTNLAKTAQTTTSVSLSWTAVGGATYYDVYRASPVAGGWGPWTKVNDANVLGTTYVDNAANSTPDPVSGQTYLYAVTAVDGSGSSPFSNTVPGTLVTAGASLPPGDFLGDLDVFLNTAEFAEQATYTKFGSGPVVVKVIFDAPYTPSTATGSEQEPENSLASCLGKTSDFEGAGNKDTLAIAGITFNVYEVKPDGTGLTRVMLTKD